MPRVATHDPLDRFRFRVVESTKAPNAEYAPNGDANIAAGQPSIIPNSISSESAPITDKDGNPLPDLFSVFAGFSEVQMPKLSTSKITYREGDNNNVRSISPGLTTTEDITLSRGIVVGDTAKTFYTWAQTIHQGGSTDADFNYTVPLFKPVAEQDFQRRDLDIIMLDRTYAPARRWRLYNCIPVNFVPGSDLNSREDGEKSIETLTIAYESFKEINIDGSGG